LSFVLRFAVSVSLMLLSYGHGFALASAVSVSLMLLSREARRTRQSATRQDKESTALLNHQLALHSEAEKWMKLLI
jgi:hypothetical protein